MNELSQFGGSYSLIWAIVGILAIVALILFIIRR